jgi:uncharacterized protein (DUF2062 family)
MFIISVFSSVKIIPSKEPSGMELSKKLNFRNYFGRAILNFLSQGITPEKLALTFSLGIILGVIPVIGVTTLLCTGVAIYLRLNIAVMQFVHYLIFPVQLLLMIPFFKTGSLLFGGDDFSFSFTDISAMLQLNFWQTIQKFWVANIYAVAIWAIIAIPSYFALYYSFRVLFTYFKNISVKSS